MSSHHPDYLALVANPTGYDYTAYGVIEEDSLAKSVSAEWSDLAPAKPGSVTVSVVAA